MPSLPHTLAALVVWAVFFVLMFRWCAAAEREAMEREAEERAERLHTKNSQRAQSAGSHFRGISS